MELDPHNFSKVYYQAVFLLNGFKKLNEARLFADVVLLVGGEKIPCHKIVLMCMSEKLFQLVKDKSEVEVQIEESKQQFMSKVLSYMYTGLIEVDQDQLEDLFLFANEYQIPSLVEHLGEHMAKRLSDETIHHMLELVELTNCSSLRERCGSFMAQNFRTLRQGSSLHDLDVHVIVDMLKDANLSVRNEKEVYDFVIEYVNKKMESGNMGHGKSDDKGKGKEKIGKDEKDATKEGMLELLLPCVKFTRLQPSFLVQIETDEELMKSKCLQKLIHYAFKVKALPEFFAKEKKKWPAAFEENPHQFKSSSNYWTYLQVSPRKYAIDIGSFTLDPTQKGTTATLSNNNLTMTSTGRAVTLGTVSFSEGKHYWEVKVDKSAGNSYVILGIATKAVNLNSDLGSSGTSGGGIGWFTDSTTIYGRVSGTTTKSVPIGGIAGLLLDLDKNKLLFFVNGEKAGEITIPHDTYFPAFDTLQTTSQITLIEDPTLPESAIEYLGD